MTRLGARSRSVRARCLVIAGAATVLLPTGQALGEEPLRGTLSCAHRSSPGRVVCELELEVTSGSLVWADLVVVEAPDFAPPLRSRVGPGEARATTNDRIRLPVALVAHEEGTGRLAVRGRAVRCSESESGRTCVPESLVTTARVVVGPLTRP
jgi:hypothetical protein